MKFNILEKQKPINRNKKNIFKNILFFLLLFVSSLFIGVMILETFVYFTN